ncbi:MAG: dephospho-CoA kinase [Flavipsychrobacter sp.]|nr:dephospho-CoA kinase [Flavipsychrobacter sp.]
MLKVGITGGIGSGKSTVCQVFETLGIPVFYADAAARSVTENDPQVIAGLKALLGDDVYVNGKMDRTRVAAQVFADSRLLQQMNALVHPATLALADRWMKEQAAPYALKEAAIFFETGSNSQMDIMIGVYAPEPLRICRLLQRDHTTVEKIKERMARQMNEEEKMALCDYVIRNDETTAIIPQVLELHHKLLEKAR